MDERDMKNDAQLADGQRCDMLREIFFMQAELNHEIARGRALSFTREEWLQKNVLAIISELSEVMDEVNFKWWKNSKPIDEAALAEELADVLHFFISLCLHAGLDADALFDAYREKNRENFNRQRGLSSKEGYKPV